ncbi:MAG TPA: type II CAAX endopeptidase family protein [Tissierellaceae bacterium]
MNKDKRTSIFGVNSLFMIAAVFLIFLGTIAQRKSMWTGSIFVEIFIILIPSLLYVKFNENSFSEVLKLNPLRIKDLILVILITILLYPVAVFFQAIFIAIINLVKPIIPNQMPLPKNLFDFIKSIIVIAIVPGICEEIMFRGVILDGYKKIGYKHAIVISSILFGLMHFTLANLIGPTILGVAFAIMVYRTNSIYSSIIAHIINNSIAVLLGYLIETNEEILDSILYMENTVIIYMPFVILAILFIVKMLFERLGTDKYKYSIYEYDILEDNLGYGKLAYYSPVIVVIFLFIYINLMYVLI